MYSYFDFGPKNNSFWLPYQRPSSSADCTRELFMGSNGSASLVDCTRKNFLVGGCVFFPKITKSSWTSKSQTPWSQLPVVAAWVLLQLSQSCRHPKDLAKTDCHNCPKPEQANGQSQELPANFASLCSVQITWMPPSVSTCCCRPPAADPTRWHSKRSLFCPTGCQTD